VDAANNDGATALMLASKRGHVEVVRVLLASGANKRLIANNGDTAYGLAVLTLASTAAIRALLDLVP
jgi:ankyrin repeat protein